MSIDKWLLDDGVNIKKKHKDEKFNSLPIEEKEDLKKKQIRKLLKHESIIENGTGKTEDFFSQVIKFKEWLNNRNYLKGDLQKIEVWIKNLHELLIFERNLEQTNEIFELKDTFKKIPPDFLDDKFRMPVLKKLDARKLNNSDRYYLKKLKILIERKMKEASYYEILKRILEGKE